MNPDIKAKWVAALRSGEYKQGYGALHCGSDDPKVDGGFCCLGVLCEVAVKEGVIDAGFQAYSWSNFQYGSREGGILPESVCRWADVTAVPDIHDGPATHWNDTVRFNFEQIAEMIESDGSL